jgi:hypothetical protein
MSDRRLCFHPAWWTQGNLVRRNVSGTTVDHFVNNRAFTSGTDIVFLEPGTAAAWGHNRAKQALKRWRSAVTLCEYQTT